MRKLVGIVIASMVLGTLGATASFAQRDGDDWYKLNREAARFYKEGNYGAALIAAQKLLVLLEKERRSEDVEIAKALTLVGTIFLSQGMYAEAGPIHKRSLEIREKALGVDHPDLIVGLINVGASYTAAGQYPQAESVYKRALAISEKAFGPDHPTTAQCLNNLGGLYHSQGRLTDAEPLYLRALSIRESDFGPNHQIVGYTVRDLAELYGTLGQYAKAENFSKRALSITERSLGQNHPDVAQALNLLAELYKEQGQYAQAEPLYIRSLAIWEKAHGPEHPYVAMGQSNLADLYKLQGKFDRAEPLFKRALSSGEKIFGPDHFSAALALNNLAGLYFAQGEYAKALPLSRKVTALYRNRIVDGGENDNSVLEAAKNREGFFRHLSLLSRNPGREASAVVADESFQVVQLEQTTGTGTALAKMAARFATGDDALASLVKRKQDAGERYKRNEATLLGAASQPPETRNASLERATRADSAQLEKEIAAVDGELATRFPEYQELTRPSPVSIERIRSILKAGEAMLVYAFGSECFLWVVTPDGADFLRLEVDGKDIAAKVAAFREQMDVEDGVVKQVNLGILHELYQRVLAPAVPRLVGVKHIMVVPAGPLHSIPLDMLVVSPPPDVRGHGDYRKVDWAIRHHAFSVLPTVSSIQALRRFTKIGNAPEPFVGFGDPLVGQSAGTVRGKRSGIDIATVYGKTAVRGSGPREAARPGEIGIADVDAIRRIPRLPETADELQALGKILNAGPNSIWVRENATETRLKAIDLTKYRTLAFATHGIMAGDVNGVGEPGLILTPPTKGTLEDDGYISASEIARLRLNADWVILSACNTAAADGSLGAEGLSGLAKAFFYAGARSLLVSHWPVVSEATVLLTTSMLREYNANPGLGKAEAHRKAILSLMDTPKRPEYAHPLFWAPFVVAGEGGGGTISQPKKRQ